MAWQPKGSIKGPPGIAGPPGATGAEGPKGDTGSQGPAGATGAQGTAGEKWSAGAGPPVGTAPGPILGDWYLDTNTGDVYEKTGGTVWTLRGNIKGPKGDAGPTGAQGIQGPQGPTGPQGAAEGWYSGLGAPATGTGNVGDWYLDVTTGNVYEKTAASVWTSRGNIKGATGATGSQGPQGAQGATGAQGPKGDTGATGPQGPQGPAGTIPTYASLQTATGLTQAIAGIALKMCGLGATAKITPTTTGKVLVEIVMGAFWTTPVTAGAGYVSFGQGRYGTGAAPAANAIAVGTIFGNTTQGQAANAAGQVSYTRISALLNLVVGTAYWFDVALQSTDAAATANIASTHVTATELP